jgi:D-alanyl-lipoteichoic acid acyltransferase DltB (MBOAT superfamily)
MTLTQWIRSYVFNPMTRKMRSNKAHPLPPWLIILVTQMTTMLIIGLWHGWTVNFLIWGAWHGFGLFFHQQYYQITKNLITELQEHKRLLYHAYTILSTTVTIFFVMAGWIWFVIPSTGDALQFFSRLFLEGRYGKNFPYFLEISALSFDSPGTIFADSASSMAWKNQPL